MSETGTGAADEAIAAFWNDAKHRAKLTTMPGYFGANPTEAVPPPAWSFGATPEHADELLALVLEGTKTATASALWDYEAEDEPLPEVGTLGIVLDSAGRPQALLVTTEVTVVPFDEVDEEHARLEGEGDRSLAYWRQVHEEFFTDHATHGHGFRSDMPVVLERFEVLHRA
ncbi:ASCH domain-containing protein [Nocardioides panacisoli]|uniref:ASCH domain-containing protein n=1 Tax=Nocardioides panacisoli TaxID=627624 RepID=UPI001C62CA97|nr:ASCH domain-containing protein [Nocardioides panacisoli]QYJ04989.1 ASCH domain-containing protein [Nocardioides panacisoli]